jgi:hypothetical protein
MALQLSHQTAAEFASRFWQRVLVARQGGDKHEFHRLIWWLIERINAGDITDGGARVSFNDAYGRSLTAGQWATLKTTRLIPIHDRYAALQAEEDL